MAENKVGFKPTAVNPMGLSALIRNLGRDCTPDQFIREFVKNSIEACQRTGITEREIILDLNHGIAEKSGLFKLSFTDNGDGMTLEQMENLLNNLSASGPQQNEHQNYGVGAKIASLTRNHFGVHYESWKNNEGHAILIRYNPKFDVFGIQGYPDENGDISYSRKLSDDQKPNCISEHGTCVTLFGMNLEHDTMAPPQGMPGDKRAWLLNYLNRRFFKIPKGIQLRVRVGYDQEKNNPALNYLAEAKGFGAMADDNSQDKGVMELRDASAYWWILKPNVKLLGQSGLLNQDEVFDLQGDRSNRLTLFGILLGRDRVIILIEPKEAVQNTSRTSLKKPDGNELSWNTWQDEFRANLPQPIVQFMNSLLSDYGQTQSRQIYSRLMSLEKLYEMCGYKTLKVNLLRDNIKKPKRC
jgi:Histidine kinase-, DNA gyrase B-, and HSP90-like ATPase